MMPVESTITITKVKNFEPRQVDFGWMGLDMFPTKEEAILFAKDYRYWNNIEVWENGVMIEKISVQKHNK